MKRLILLFALICCFHLATLSAQDFQITPAHPQAGQAITVEYNPTGSELEGEKVAAVVYFLQRGEMPQAHDLEMTQAGPSYKGSVDVPASAQSVFVKFTNEDGSKSDNNNDDGYRSLLYKDGKPGPGAYLSSFPVYGSYSRILGVEANKEKSISLFEKAINGDASKKMHKDYISSYATVARYKKDDAMKAEIGKQVESVMESKNPSEKDLSKMANVAQIIGKKDLSAKINEKNKKLFPKGKLATNALFTEARKIKDLDEKIAKYNEMKTVYAGQNDYERSLERLVSSIASDYGKKGDFKTMEMYAEQISNSSSRSGLYNSLAWGFSGESIDGEASHLVEAEKIAMKSLKLLEAEMSACNSKPEYYSKTEYARSLNYTYGNTADTYALVAYKNGKAKDAVKYQKIACKNSKFKNAEMNERYAIYLEKDQGAKEAMNFLEHSIEEGHANSGMKAQFKKLFAANVSMDDASQMYLAKLEAKAKEKHIAEIKEGMINKKAPDFALTNLNGDAVSLESLKGKVVVVDFWATWCGPCKASFPGMQKAVTKYDTASDVEFVFVDTWESAKNKEENAKKFIDEKGYTFNVLMDNKNKMVEAYEVSGIPTKFILDKEGNIRFKSSGFGGNDDALVDEISIVVELLRGKADGESAAGAQP